MGIVCSNQKPACPARSYAGDQSDAAVRVVSPHPPAPVYNPRHPNSGLRCFACGKPGHKANQCPDQPPREADRSFSSIPKGFAHPKGTPPPSPMSDTKGERKLPPLPEAFHRKVNPAAARPSTSDASSAPKAPPDPPGTPSIRSMRAPDPQPAHISDEESPNYSHENKFDEFYFLLRDGPKGEVVRKEGVYMIVGLVDNRKIELLVDAGSSFSVLQSEWVEREHVTMVDECGFKAAEVYGRDMPGLPIRGMTRQVPVTVEGINTEHKFLVIDGKEGDPDGIIGVDLMAKLGYYITNTNFRVPQSIQHRLKENEERDNTKDDLRTRTCTPHEKRDEILRAVQPLLKENEERVAGFCKRQEAIVDVPIPGDVPAPYVPQYNVPHESLEAMDRKIQEWIDNGKVRQVDDAEGNNPLTAATKRHPVTGHKSEWRTCLDIRRVNDILKKMGIEVPNNLLKMEDIFARLSGFEVYSVIDIADAFPSMKLNRRSRRFFRFSWNGRRYEFIGAPFGLMFLTTQFQHLMMTIFKNETDFVMIFVDDIIVFSKSVEEHIVHLRRVITKLTAENLKTREIKGQFGFTDVYLLGHKAGKRGIEIDQRKLMGMMNWPTPTASTIEHYLGLMNYFRRFIPCYAKHTSPLEQVRKTFSWGEKQERAWNRMKDLLAAAPILHQTYWVSKYLVGNGGSRRAVSAVVFQPLSDGAYRGWTVKGTKFLGMKQAPLDVKIIGFASRATTGTEKWYSAYKLELAAILLALGKFRNMLLGRCFDLFSSTRLASQRRETAE